MLKLTSKELKDFFVGNLLGDANIHNKAFSVKQISKDLVLFKKKIIEEYLPDAKVKITSYSGYIDKNGVNHQDYYYLYMSPHPYIAKLYNEFYPQGKKIVPKKYTKHMSLIGYAIWYADDGTTILVGYNKHSGSANSRRIEFCTDGFTKKDVIELAKMISRQYGTTSIVKRKENQYRIRIQVQDGQQFLIDIHKYFYKYFPSMLYKMDMGYRNKSLEREKYVSEEYKKIYFKISAHSSFIDRISPRKIKSYDIV